VFCSTVIMKVTRVIGIALFAVGSTTALAHTTILNQMTEGVSTDNATRIAHGCFGPSGVPRMVVASTVLFPTVNPQVTSSDGSAIANLGDVITVPTLAGLVQPILDRGLFQKWQMKVDSLGNRIGFSATKGTLEAPNWAGRMGFAFSAPKFQPDSCAKSLTIRLAIVDICVGASVGDYGPGDVNWWIPDGSKYADASRAANNHEALDVGFTPTLVINRNLTTNPLPAVCGDGINVTVTPSGADVDANLSIPGYWE
jgi:hypothetical protein